MDERYQEKRARIEQRFVEDNLIAERTEVSISPSGAYELTIQTYKTEGWNYTRGIVKRVADGSLIADIKRNYGHFWYQWCAHPNSQKYLLCGEDYQGYMVVNLTRGEVHIYFPEAGYAGVGFCWASVYPSPDFTLLAVEGCYWASPYEIVFFDFTTPDELPYREVVRIDAGDAVVGWKDNHTFVMKTEQEFRLRDGKLYYELSRAEQEELDNDPSLVGIKVTMIEYQPPRMEKGAEGSGSTSE